MKKSLLFLALSALPFTVSAEILEFDYEGVVTSIYDNGSTTPAFVLPDGTTNVNALINTTVSGKVFVDTDPSKMPNDYFRADPNKARHESDRTGFLRATLTLDATGQEFGIDEKNQQSLVAIGTGTKVTIQDSVNVSNDQGTSAYDVTQFGKATQTSLYSNGYMTDTWAETFRLSTGQAYFRNTDNIAEPIYAILNSTGNSSLSITSDRSGGSSNEMNGKVSFRLTRLNSVQNGN